MGAGAALAMESADVTLMDSHLDKLVYSIIMGRQVISKIKQNILFSMAVKVVVLGFALAGKTSLWAAIASDVGAMILVTLNAMLLLPSRQKSKEAANHSTVVSINEASKREIPQGTACSKSCCGEGNDHATTPLKSKNRGEIWDEEQGNKVGVFDANLRSHVSTKHPCCSSKIDSERGSSCAESNGSEIKQIAATAKATACSKGCCGEGNGYGTMDGEQGTRVVVESNASPNSAVSTKDACCSGKIDLERGSSCLESNSCSKVKQSTAAAKSTACSEGCCGEGDGNTSYF
jgi:hypothetical protein